MVTRIREESSKHEGGADYHGEEDDDIDDLIQQSIGEICPSRQTSHFSQLHVRLMNAGSVKDVKLSGVPCGSGAWKGGKWYCETKSTFFAWAISFLERIWLDSQSVCVQQMTLRQHNSTVHYIPPVYKLLHLWTKPKHPLKKPLGRGGLISRWVRFEWSTHVSELLIGWLFWFEQPATMTDDLKRDIKIIQMRNYLDSKRYFSVCCCRICNTASWICNIVSSSSIGI